MTIAALLVVSGLVLVVMALAGTVLQRLDTAAPAAVSAEDDTEEETVAGPIAIAVDVTDTSEDNSPVAPAGADVSP